MNKFKLYFGYHVFFNWFFVFIVFFLQFEHFISPLIFQFLLIYIWILQIVLFFWMTWHLIKNKNLKNKPLWFLFFCVMFIGVIFYFWFIYRVKYKDTKILE